MTITHAELNKAVQSQIALNNATSGYSVALTKTAFRAKILRGIFGKFYDVTVSVSASLKNLSKLLLNPVKLFTLMGTAITGILSSFTLIIGVIMAVGAAFILLGGGIGRNTESMEILREAFNKVKDAMMMVIEKISEFDFGPAIEVSKIAVQGLADLFIISLALMVVAVEDIVNFLINTFAPVFEELSTAVDDLGITSDGVFSEITSAVEMLKRAFDSAAFQDIIEGIIDVLKLYAEIYAALTILYIASIVKMVKYLQKFADNNTEVVEGIKNAFVTMIKIVVNNIMFIIDAFALILENILALIKGDIGIIEAFKNIVSGIGGLFIDWVDGLKSLISQLGEDLTAPFAFLEEKVLEIFGRITDAMPSMPGWVSDLGGGALDALSFASGGVSSGPTSGYPVQLHGTEAVVPLPDGKTIPVSLQGGGGGEGGGSPTINITMNGVTGNANDIAKAVSSEVQKAFKTRSRSSGYGRGI